MQEKKYFLLVARWFQSCASQLPHIKMEVWNNYHNQIRKKNKHEPLGPIIRTLANMNIVQKKSYYKPQLVYERGFAVILFKTFPLSSKGHTLFPASKYEDPILTQFISANRDAQNHKAKPPPSMWTTTEKYFTISTMCSVQVKPNKQLIRLTWKEQKSENYEDSRFYIQTLHVGTCQGEKHEIITYNILGSTGYIK